MLELVLGHMRTVNAQISLRISTLIIDVQVDGKSGPGRPKMTWNQPTERIAESGSCRLSTLMIDIPEDLV